MPTTSGDPSKAATATEAPDRPALSDIVAASDYAARVQGVAERIVEAKHTGRKERACHEYEDAV